MPFTNYLQAQANEQNLIVAKENIKLLFFPAKAHGQVNRQLQGHP